MIRIFDEKGKQIGLGKAQYDSKKQSNILVKKEQNLLFIMIMLLINEKN